MTVDAYMGCYCRYVTCTCTCTCNQACSCSWAPLSAALNMIFNASMSTKISSNAYGSLDTRYNTGGSASMGSWPN